MHIILSYLICWLCPYRIFVYRINTFVHLLLCTRPYSLSVPLSWYLPLLSIYLYEVIEPCIVNILQLSQFSIQFALHNAVRNGRNIWIFPHRCNYAENMRLREWHYVSTCAGSSEQNGMLITAHFAIVQLPPLGNSEQTVIDNKTMCFNA